MGQDLTLMIAVSFAAYPQQNYTRKELEIFHERSKLQKTKNTIH
jgi:hypothetical protein